MLKDTLPLLTLLPVPPPLCLYALQAWSFLKMMSQFHTKSCLWRDVTEVTPPEGPEITTQPRQSVSCGHLWQTYKQNKFRSLPRRLFVYSSAK